MEVETQPLDSHVPFTHPLDEKTQGFDVLFYFWQWLVISPWYRSSSIFFFFFHFGLLEQEITCKCYGE